MEDKEAALDLLRPLAHAAVRGIGPKAELQRTTLVALLLRGLRQEGDAFHLRSVALQQVRACSWLLHFWPCQLSFVQLS